MVATTARLGRLALELDELAVDPDLRAAAQDALEVDHRRCVAADDDDGQAGRAALRGGERGDVFGDRGPDLVGDRPAFEKSGAACGIDQPRAGAAIGLARLAAADGFARRPGEALDLVEQARRRGRSWLPRIPGRRPTAG